MLSDVVCLRYRGSRLPPEQVKQAIPVRGLLRVESRSGYGWDSSGRSLCAVLTTPGVAVAALPMLDHCRVARITDRGILIVGVEEVDLTGRQWKNFRQAWWVRPVHDPTQSL